MTAIFSQRNLNPPFESWSDDQLALRSQSGDSDAFAVLVSRYRKRIYAFVYGLCRHDTDARELTQETFVSAWQHIQSFDAARAFAPWVFAIARRKFLDYLRRRPPLDYGEVPEASSSDVETCLVETGENDIWHIARRILSDAQFQAVWLRYAEDLSVAEIAQTMRSNVCIVKVQLFRARRKLARRLASERFSWARANRNEGLKSELLGAC